MKNVILFALLMLVILMVTSCNNSYKASEDFTYLKVKKTGLCYSFYNGYQTMCCVPCDSLKNVIVTIE